MVMAFVRRYALFCLLLIVNQQGLAQLPAMRLFTTDDGMPTLYLGPLLVDRYGFLWLGSGEGFTAFDGTNFVNFGRNQGFSDVPESAFEDSTGTIWIAARFGVWKVKRSALFPLKLHFQKLPLGEPTAMTLSPSNTTVVATLDGLFEISQDTIVQLRILRAQGNSDVWEEFKIGKDRGEAIFSFLAYDHNGSLIVGDPFRLYRAERSLPNQSLYLVVENLSRDLFKTVDKRLSQVTVDHRNRILCMREDHRLFMITSYRRPVEVPLRQHGISKAGFLAQDSEHNLWLDDGLRLHQISLSDDPAPSVPTIAVHTFRFVEGIPSAFWIVGVLRDRQNNLWGGIGMSGLFRVNPQGFLFLSPQEIGLPSVYGVSESTAERFWLIGGELRMIQLETGSRLIPTARISTPLISLARESEQITGAFAAGQDTILLKSNEGSLWLMKDIANPKPSISLLHIKQPEGIDFGWRPMQDNVAWLKDRDGYLWICRNTVAVFRCIIRHDSLVLLDRYTDQNGLPDNGVRVIYQTRDGAIWFGGYSNGLSRFDGKGFTKFTEADGLINNAVRSLYEYPRGKLWIGTRYGGMCVYKNGKFYQYPEYKDLRTNTIWSILEDGTGTLWLGTEQGLKSFIPDTALLQPPRVQHFGLDDGIPQVPLYAHLMQGWLLCPTPKGLYFVNLRVLRSRHEPSGVYLASLEVNGQEIGVDRQLDLSPSENTLSFAFNAIDLSGRDVLYQYRLEGLDERWSDPSPTRKITFGKLSPGTYRFSVRTTAAATQLRENVRNVSDHTPDKTASLIFTIATPFWRSWWFITLVVVLIAATGAILYNYRLQQLLRLERMRGRIATDLHDDIGTSLTRIALFSDVAHRQLQTLLKNKSKKPAEKASLMVSEIGKTSRELIDAMSDIVWSVDPRNDAFENFVLRMKNYAARLLEAKDIKYEFVIPENLSTLKLPLDFIRHVFLIFKEALNNIIRHGHATKVNLTMYRDGDSLTMVVRDNGVGLHTDLTARPVESSTGGHGLANMRHRAELLHGAITFTSKAKAGTTLTLRAKLP
jgi:signal transduction histidine kinase